MATLRNPALFCALLGASLSLLVTPSCGLVATFDRSRIDEDAGLRDQLAPSVEGGGEDPRLRSLTLDVAPLVPTFQPDVATYSARFRLPFAFTAFATKRVGVTPTTFDPRASIDVDNGTPIPTTSGETAFVSLGASRSVISVRVVTPELSLRQQYDVSLDVLVSDYLKASNTRSNARFGGALAISGSTLVVGSRGEASNATGVNGDESDTSLPGAGAVYVFTRSGTTWKQEAYIKGTSLAPNESFGTAVALSGNTLAIGAPGDGANAGSVRVFTRTGTVWTQQALLRASNIRPDDAAYGSGAHFGATLALSGDDLVVGAPEEPSAAIGIGGDQSNVAAPNAGAVYTFTRSGTLWTQRAYVKSSHTSEDSRFGASVSLAGGTLAVGSEFGVSTSRGGAVYLFTKNGVSWTGPVYVEASNPSRDALFGTAVALSPSGTRLAVGAEREPSGARGIGGDQSDTSADGAGAVYVFTKSGTAWPQEAYFKPSNTREAMHFGHAVALAEDKLVVGAWGEPSKAVGFGGDDRDVSMQSSGAAYVFERKGTWSQTKYVKASNPGNVAFFGDAVAATDAILAVGALGEKSAAVGVNGNETDASLFFAGAVYVY